MEEGMLDYSLGIPEVDEITGGVPKGTNIMLLGPPLTGKHLLIRHIIYHTIKEGDSAVLVSTRDTGDEIIEWFSEYLEEEERSRIGIVDCVTKSLGKNIHDKDVVKYASSPVDLTGIGIKISQFFEEFIRRRQIPKTILCIDSVSTLLMYTNIQTLFRFLHVFTGRVKLAGAIGIYVVDEGMHDDKSINTLKQLFPAVFEVRTDGEENHLRILGLGSKPTPWKRYEIDGVEVVIKSGE
ncbi:MAG: RAD55 family ATPase [Methanosarcinales archaeon]